MKINILAFGIAKDIIQGQTKEIELKDGNDVQSLKAKLCEQFPEFEKLRSFSIAVNEAYQNDDFELKESDEVVIIPPVSGG
jgi:molybdopterin converting factor subunit 1